MFFFFLLLQAAAGGPRKVSWISLQWQIYASKTFNQCSLLYFICAYFGLEICLGTNLCLNFSRLVHLSPKASRQHWTRVSWSQIQLPCRPGKFLLLLKKHNLILSFPRSKSCFSLLVSAYFFVGLCKEFSHISTPYLNTSIGRIISRFGSNCHRNAHRKMRVFQWNKNVPFIFLSEPVCIERTKSSCCLLSCA